MTPHLLAASAVGAPLLASLQSALDQPFFPGKLVIWLLLMLSIVAWVSILSKAFQLARSRRADRRFLSRLRQSRETMEVYEEGFEGENSPHFALYLAGARETALQLLGTKQPEAGLERRLRAAGPLAGTQAECLRRAFKAACRRGIGQLRSGLGTLRLIASAAVLVGLFGTAWAMMGGFDRMESLEALGEVLGTALGFFVISLFVAAPAILARQVFAMLLERREEQLLKFRDDVTRLFERRFGPGAKAAAGRGQSWSESGTTVLRFEDEEGAEDHDSATPGIVGEDAEGLPPTRVEGGAAPGKVYHSGKKRYRSIRDRLLAEAEEDPDPSLEMNPIARQAAAMQRR